ncbi:MAG: amidohydrolase [Thermodesulfobacteriota bacterium]
MRNLKITVIQTDLSWEDSQRNLAGIGEKLQGLGEETHLIILPEMFATGFSMNAASIAQDMQGPAVAWLLEQAEKSKADIAGSLAVREKGRFFNRLIWVRPSGDILTYDKKHLFRYAGEEKVYTAGDRLLTVELNGWRIRPFICYDLRFPCWCRNWNKAYDLAVYVANWPAKRAAHWKALLPARAIENQCYVAGVNRVGTDGNGMTYSGDSAVIDPLGTTLFQKSSLESVQTVELSLALLREYRQHFPAWMDADDPAPAAT